MAFLLFDAERCLAYTSVFSSSLDLSGVDVDSLVNDLAESPHGECLLRTTLDHFFSPIMTFMASGSVTVVLIGTSTNMPVCSLVKRLIEKKTGFTRIHVTSMAQRSWLSIKDLWRNLYPDGKELKGQQVLYMDDTDQDELRKDPLASGICVVHCKPYEYRITPRHVAAVDRILAKYGLKATDPKQTGIVETFDEDEDGQSLSLVQSFLEQTTRFA
jgi:hypothetical protein